MTADYIIAYSIINKICENKGFPMYILMNKNLYGGNGNNVIMSQIKAISAHNIRSKTSLTHKQIGQLFKLSDHTASIYFGNLYNAFYKTDKHFRSFADSALN